LPSDTEDAAGTRTELTFAELRERSARFAGALLALGVGPGDRVATLLPKSPELVAAAIGIWRLGAVHVPLFTAFGPQAIAYRLADSDTKVVVTDRVNRPKVEEMTASTKIVIGGASSGDVDFETALAGATPLQTAAVQTGDDPIILIYTSGTTGNPKGVQVAPVRSMSRGSGTFRRLRTRRQSAECAGGHATARGRRLSRPRPRSRAVCPLPASSSCTR
jgi:acetyl-CoA synthetase